MANPILHGPGFSTYVRSVRITLAEKGVDYELREFNFLEGWPEGYEKLNPFMKVPVFEHDELSLYETPAIMVYVNANFDGPALLPELAGMRAKAVQVINIVDNYAYNALITRTFIPRVVVPMLGGTTDETVIEEARSDCERCIAVLNSMVEAQDYFGGDNASLADFHMVPVVHYTSLTPEGQTLLTNAPALSAWAERMNARSSVTETIPSFG